MDTQAPMFDTEDIDAVVVEVQEEAHPMLTVEVCRELNIEGFDEKLKQPCIAKTGGEGGLIGTTARCGGKNVPIYYDNKIDGS